MMKSMEMRVGEFDALDKRVCCSLILIDFPASDLYNPF